MVDDRTTLKNGDGKSCGIATTTDQSSGRKNIFLNILSKLQSTGVTKRCRLSWLTNSVLVYEPKCERGGGGGAGYQSMSTAVHRSPNKLLEI